VDDAPIAVSPDGKSLIYTLDRRLWKVSINGNHPRQLREEIASNPTYSSNGDRIAYVTGDSQRPEPSRLVVTNAAGDQILWSETAPSQGMTLRWMPDGNSLLLLNWTAHNVWMYPLRGRPKQLTNFDDFVWSFDVAHDGKSLIAAQGSLARDAVLITGFR
jgi:Tol biopolymer transport system component